jgi:hypothetical protein
MTKSENRAAAKAYQEEKLRKWREAIKADLEQLEKLRRYIMFRWKSGARPEALKDAIDDCAGMLTGDRTVLHEKGSSIG